MRKIKTQVGIIGAGPAGLLLGQMLYNRGIEAVILESRDRDYVRARLRAGVQEQNTVSTFIAEGVGKNLQANNMVHKGIYLHFNNEKHYLNVEERLEQRQLKLRELRKKNPKFILRTMERKRY